MAHHQGRDSDLLDDVGDGEGLSRTGHPQEHVVFLPPAKPLEESGDRRRLVTRRPVGGFDLKVHGVTGSCRIRTYNLLVKSQQLYH